MKQNVHNGFTGWWKNCFTGYSESLRKGRLWFSCKRCFCRSVKSIGCTSGAETASDHYRCADAADGWTGICKTCKGNFAGEWDRYFIRIPGFHVCTDGNEDWGEWLSAQTDQKGRFFGHAAPHVCTYWGKKWSGSLLSGVGWLCPWTGWKRRSGKCRIIFRNERCRSAAGHGESGGRPVSNQNRAGCAELY